MFNNVAIAAKHAQREHGLHRCVLGWLLAGEGREEQAAVRHTYSLHALCRAWSPPPNISPVLSVPRILIVDWDIHHGQGIQYIFEDDPR